MTPTIDKKPALWQLTDPDTGESREVLLTKHDEADRGGPAAKKPRRYSNQYAVVFDRASEILMRDRRLGASEHRVLHALFRTASFVDHEWAVNGPKLAEMTIMQRPDVIRSITKLVEVGILIRPRRGVIRFNPEMAWRGGVESREQALAEKIASAQGAEEAMAIHMVHDA